MNYDSYGSIRKYIKTSSKNIFILSPFVVYSGKCRQICNSGCPRRLLLRAFKFRATKAHCNTTISLSPETTGALNEAIKAAHAVPHNDPNQLAERSADYWYILHSTLAISHAPFYACPKPFI